MSKGTPFETVEFWLKSYPEWKSKIESLKAQLNHIPGLTQRFELVAIHGKGQVNQATLNEVIKRMEIEDQELPLLELRVHLIEISFSALTPDERNFVNLKYIDKMTNNLTMDRLKLSRRAFFRMRRNVLDKIYRLLGGSKSLMWVEPSTID